MNRETVIKLSKLSAFALTDEESDLLLYDLQKIMEFASEIENDYEENDGSGIPVENSLGESHRKCTLQKRNIIRELKENIPCMPSEG